MVALGHGTEDCKSLGKKKIKFLSEHSSYGKKPSKQNRNMSGKVSAPIFRQNKPGKTERCRVSDVKLGVQFPELLQTLMRCLSKGFEHKRSSVLQELSISKY